MQLPESVLWHFIGHLQSNKCALIAGASVDKSPPVPTDAGIRNLHVVETVDSIKLATALNKVSCTACCKSVEPAAPPGGRQSRTHGAAARVRAGQHQRRGRCVPPWWQDFGHCRVEKSGCDAAEVGGIVQHIAAACPALVCTGLMTIGKVSPCMLRRPSPPQVGREVPQGERNPDFVVCARAGSLG